MKQKLFIDREAELGRIERALEDLLNKERLLQTPIIDFYGVDGIGKTSLLKKIMQKCDENELLYIDVNVNQGLPLSLLLQNVKDLVRKYKQLLPQNDDDKDVLQQFIEHVEALLEQRPLVMLLDAVDTTNENHLKQLGKMLSQLEIHNNFFVVLTSRGNISFEHEKSVRRKITPILVRPFNRTFSDLYLDNAGSTLTIEMRNIIFEWTRGYPLAMQVMVDAIIEQEISSIDEIKQKELINLIVDRVINQRILSDVSQDELSWFQKVLSLLAVPRRFNLVIIKDLIEQFESDLQLPSSLAYIVLPKRVIQATNAMSWSIEKAGFALDESIRNILLRQLKITNTQRYHEINHFLAEINWSSSIEATGSDRIRYQREYLYHSANSVEKQLMPQVIDDFIKISIDNVEYTSDQLIELREEFIQDNELREALEGYALVLLDLIDYKLAHKMYILAFNEKNEDKRVLYLHTFFTYINQRGSESNLAIELKEKMRQFLVKEKPAIILRLYEEVAQHEQLRDALRKDFPILFSHL